MTSGYRSLVGGLRALSTSRAAFSAETASLPSSAGSVSPSSSALKPVKSKKPKRKAIKVVHRNVATKHSIKTDNILRRAVELYHLAPCFLPTPKQGSTSDSARSDSSSAWETALDNTIYNSILNTDSVSRRSPNVMLRGLTEFSRDQSNRAASVPSFGESGSSASRREKDTNSFASDLTSTTFLTRGEREAAASSTPTPEAQSPLKSVFKSSQSDADALDHFTDHDIAMYQKRHSQGLGSTTASGRDSSRYSGAERLTHLNRVTPGSNEWYRSQDLDTRSARVRDAIFGTINGELPGLEVVRERIARMRSSSKGQGAK